MILGRNYCNFGLRALTYTPKFRPADFSGRYASSLSAVHRGLRLSERSSFQGHSPRRGSVGARRSDDASSPAFKIRKGKKDISEPPPLKRQTRSSRFNDPNDSFGKKSLVYQLKSGQLRDKLAALQDSDTQARPRSPASGERTQENFWDTKDSAPKSSSRDAASSQGRTGRLGRVRSSSSSTPWGTGRGRTSSREWGEASTGREWGRDRRSASEGFGSRGFEKSGGRDSERFRSREFDNSNSRNSERFRSRGFDDSNSRDSDKFRSRGFDDSNSRDSDKFRSRGFENSSSRDSEQFRSRDADEFRSRDFEGSRRRPEPTLTTIKYTTAASQFLYGKFVVEEALRASRRKLYHLYIYGGSNRQNVGQDVAVERLAEKKGVPITILGEQDQKLMSKMSMGRPHNGYILEASPVPQPPVTALGPLSESESDGNGFGVSLAHQSAEDAAVNGKVDFVPTRSGRHKPLVLMLDHILDPGNLGAILRTASFLGVSAVAISTKNSATLTPVALKASAGASESIPLFAVENPASFLEESREAGWRVYAAVAAQSGSRSRTQVDMNEVEELDPLADEPCILVMGSEGEGLPRMLKAKAQVEVSIPNHSGSVTVDSLNVSVATALLCSAFMKGPNKALMSHRRKGPIKSDELGIW